LTARIFLIALVAACRGCKVGPNYARPDVQPPSQYRAGEVQPTPESFGDVKWFDLFRDPVLRDLIAEALRTNFDVRMAAQRVLQAEGQLAVTRSALYPRLGVEAGGARTGLHSPIQSLAGAFGVASWEPDLFGKIRRATEAAQADLAVTREDQLAILQILVSQVATAYFDLREYDLELELVNESIKTRQDSLNLVVAREQGGVSNRLEVDQAKSLVSTAQSQASLLEQAREQTENLISYLLARQPGPIARGPSLVDQYQPPKVPGGLPSSLLARRPDLRLAEQELIAANARVGVA
jgi:multidrug efflux system outer membrane protein